MKTVVDYLREHKIYEHGSDERNFTLELKDDVIHLDVNNWHMEFECTTDINIILEVLEKYHNIEVRICEECGKPFDAGYTVDSGWYYCCEECFEEMMDRDYGKGKWQGTDDQGEYGGYYAYLNDDGEWEDTGIYYTEWY